MLFAANTVDTEEEEQIHLNEIVSIKCFALIFDVFFVHFFGANLPGGKSCLGANTYTFCLSKSHSLSSSLIQEQAR